MTHAHTQINQWLTQIHPALGLDQNGACVLAAGEGRNLELFVGPQGEEFMLSTTLMDLPANSNGGFYMKVLSMNLFMQETRGATIACDEQAGELVLCHNQAVEGCDLTLFQNILQNFSRTAETVQNQLAEIPIVAEAPAAPASSYMNTYQPPMHNEPVFEDVDPMRHIGKLV
ncbi:CesT family type III secretion system chaperone [Acanthopleuribacter pedis]|uniref:CesT family type III secretion system chaperone n=1 Tax=Acanthopleuribacter pedis TaxID=442870 RepID=A0A8J7U624_9BACT|nr:CesT family type III secretion system chaperone [Acanthopleuribacter pedis]MBO1322322.1 CesT family type III secretion system chaperone [Acanthopleuribacter pedis]